MPSKFPWSFCNAGCSSEPGEGFLPFRGTKQYRVDWEWQYICKYSQDFHRFAMTVQIFRFKTNAKVHGDPHQSFLMPFAPLRVKASGDGRAGTPRSLHLCPMLAPVFSPVVKKILAEKYVAVDLCPAPVTLCWTVLAHYMCTCPCTCMRLLMECPPQLAFCSKHWFSSCPAFAIVQLFPRASPARRTFPWAVATEGLCGNAVVKDLFSLNEIAWFEVKSKS